MQAGTYGIYRIEQIYCKPGDPCPDMAYIPVWIGEVTVTRPPAVEKSVSFLGASVQASPNPFRSKVRIQLRNAECGLRNISTLAVFSMNGKLVADLKSAIRNRQSAIEWDASGLPGGVYVLKAKIGGAQYSKKLCLYK